MIQLSCKFLKAGIIHSAYLFLIALGLHCCAWALVVEIRSYSLAAVLGLLTAEASLAAEHGL